MDSFPKMQTLIQMSLCFQPPAKGAFLRGSGMDQSTGRFTAPITGIYQFSANVHIGKCFSYHCYKWMDDRRKDGAVCNISSCSCDLQVSIKAPVVVYPVLSQSIMSLVLMSPRALNSTDAKCESIKMNGSWDMRATANSGKLGKCLFL